MKLRELMTRDVEVVHPNSTIKEAAEKMQTLDVGPMPVCDGSRLVGILTDRDITVRATASGLDPGTARVAEVMTPDVVYAFEDQDHEEAARLMEQHQIRRLIVLDRDKRLVGIVSLGDLATTTSDETLSGEVVTRVSEPSEPER